jgi:tetratricopeptide (TPR) repeat protein
MPAKSCLVALALFAAFVRLDTADARAAACPNIVGVWNSWASGIFGKGDTVFKSNGTATHGSGIQGVWKCEGGKIQMSWGGETPKLFTLQGNKLVNPVGIVEFSREGGAQASRSESGVQASRDESSTKEKREAPSKQHLTEAQKPERPKEPRVQPETGYFDRFAVYGVEKHKFPADVAADDDGVICANGEGEAAIAACTRQIADLQDYPGALASMYWQRGQLYGVKGEYERAIGDFDESLRQAAIKAVAQFQGQSWVYNQRGQTYGMMGDYDRALADLNEAVRLEPKFAAAFFNRGQTYRAKGEYQRAIDDFSTAIRLNPKYAAAYRMRGSANHSLKKYSTAIDDFSKAIELAPGYAAALNARGMSYMATQDYTRAVDDFDEAIRLSPGYAEAVDNLDVIVGVQTCAGSSASPENRAAACMAVIGNSSLPANVRATAYLGHAAAFAFTSSGSRQDADRALNDVTEALRLQPGNAPAYEMRAAIYVRRGDSEHALKDANNAVDLAPTSSAYAFRSLVYAGKGEKDLALADLDAAIQRAPRVAYLYLLRGDAARAKSDITRALADFDSAIRLDPGNEQHTAALAWGRKGDVESAGGNFDVAIADYDEAIRLDAGRAEFQQARAAAQGKKSEKR